MTENEYKGALEEKARHLYKILMGDPVKVPLICPCNSDIYPPEIVDEMHMQFWRDLAEEIQIIKPEFK